MPWYCCECESGGYSTIYVFKCHECNHDKCPNCSIESYDSDDGHSIHSEDAHSEPQALFNTTSPIGATLPTSDVGSCLAMKRVGGKDIVNTPTLDTGSPLSLPLTVANLTTLNASLAPQKQNLLSGYGSPADGEVTYVWYCCNCGNGPLNYYTEPACCNCHNHIRNNCCRVQAIET